MPAYGLGYGLGQALGGVPMAYMQGQQMGLQRQMGELQLQQAQNAMSDYAAAKQAGVDAWVPDPDNPGKMKLDENAYLRNLSGVSPEAYAKGANTYSTMLRAEATASKLAEQHKEIKLAQGLRLMRGLMAIPDLAKRREYFNVMRSDPEFVATGLAKTLPPDIDLTDEGISSAAFHLGVPEKNIAEIMVKRQNAVTAERIASIKDAVQKETANYHTEKLRIARSLAGRAGGATDSATIRNILWLKESFMRTDGLSAEEAESKARDLQTAGEGKASNQIRKDAIIANHLNSSIARMDTEIGVDRLSKLPDNDPRKAEYNDRKRDYDAAISRLERAEDRVPKPQKKPTSVAKPLVLPKPGTTIPYYLHPDGRYHSTPHPDIVYPK